MGTYSELIENNSRRIQELLDTVCSTTGTMTVVAEKNYELHHWAYSNEESYCGLKSSYFRWGHIFKRGHDQDLGEYTRQIRVSATISQNANHLNLLLQYEI